MNQLSGIKSYVLRSGRMSPRQRNGLENLLPQYQLSQENNLWDIPQIFQREAATFVEVGFGMGASLVTIAAQRPQDNFIGIEVHQPGIGSLAADLAEHSLHNVRIAPMDAVSVFENCLPFESITGVYILFPDPWPKKRHHKRRLIQTSFIQKVIPVLRLGGLIHCSTDWQEYADEILAVLSSVPALTNQAAEGGFMPRPEWRPLTRFELRGLKLGHSVRDICFARNA